VAEFGLYFGDVTAARGVLAEAHTLLFAHIQTF